MGEVKPYSARQEAIGNRVIRLMSRAQTQVYRWTGGRVGGRFLRGGGSASSPTRDGGPASSAARR